MAVFQTAPGENVCVNRTDIPGPLAQKCWLDFKVNQLNG